jgi:hypothetical protein
MSVIGPPDAGGGVHLGGRERIHGHDGTLGFDRAHEMIRFVIRPIALVASGMDLKNGRVERRNQTRETEILQRAARSSNPG